MNFWLVVIGAVAYSVALIILGMIVALWGIDDSGVRSATYRKIQEVAIMTDYINDAVARNHKDLLTIIDNDVKRGDGIGEAIVNSLSLNKEQWTSIESSLKVLAEQELKVQNIMSCTVDHEKLVKDAIAAHEANRPKPGPKLGSKRKDKPFLKQTKQNNKTAKNKPNELL